MPHRERHYCFTPTIDVDNSFAYAHKDLVRTIGGLLIDVKRRRHRQVRDRLAVLFRRRNDPYDTYAYLTAVHRKRGLAPIFFFLVGSYGGYDVAHSLYNLAFQRLIKAMADYFPVGIHPSFASNTDGAKLNAEIDGLQEVLHREVVRSRQHYLQLHLPTTYQRLLGRDICEDYTMLYPSEPGFRAGTATPHCFYDLDYEQATTLKVFPCVAMDGTFKNYRKMTPDASIALLQELVDEIRAVNGHCITVWHNDSVSEYDGWVGWRRVYEALLDMAA